MPDPSTLALFVVAALALLLVPGPSVLYIVARGLHQGRRARLVSALGVETGGLAHVLAATVGLSALVLSSALAFSIVKYMGAAYLVYLGVRTLLTPERVQEVQRPTPRRLGHVFWQGALVNALNPKTALFFLAFLPQFIQPERGSVALQTLTLGALFLLLAALGDSIYALLAGTVGKRLLGNRVFVRQQRYLTGGVYIALGVGTATVGHR